MSSYEHKKLLEDIAKLDDPPSEPKKFSMWIEAGGHLELLRENARSDELAIFASGEYTFVHAIVVSNDRLSPIDQEDLLKWSCSPYTSIASYVSGGGRDGIWVERSAHSTGAKTLDGGVQLIFGRTFEGWTGSDRTYFELHQEYSHLAGIHWRPEHRAYCRFDQNGDLDHLVSVTTRQEKQGDVTLVSFKWGPLEEYLAASNSSLVRMFDLTLLRRNTFTKWPDGPEQVIRESDQFFYRQKIDPGHAAYTRGVQIIRPRRSDKTVFTDIQNEWMGRRNRGYVEFIAHDWRNNRIARISTDPSATTNYFEAHKNTLPFELSPAFFRPEVLLKYKGDRDKYKVGERDVRCRSAWSLRGFDVNDAGQVHAYICYLRDLPHSEQLHWASYNEEPKAGISQRAITNDFRGEFSLFKDPLREVLSIIRSWHDRDVSWWTLHDEELLERVSTPLTTSRDEWSEAFMDLSKLVVEGFVVRVIRARLDVAHVSYDQKEQSIALLEKLLNQGNESEDTQQLLGLRTVQRIRSKLKGHSGGSEAEQLVQDALTQHETFAGHFKHVCELVSNELRTLEGLLK